MNTVWVAVGLLGATLLDRGVQKAAEKWFPSLVTNLNYIKPGVSVLTGLTLSVLADEKDDRLRLIGYGVSGAGVLSGIRLIPQVDNLLSDTPDENQTVNGLKGLLGLALGDFGQSDNIRQITTTDAEATSLDLPDLGEQQPQRVEAVAYTATPKPEGNDDFEEVIAEVI